MPRSCSTRWRRSVHLSLFDWDGLSLATFVGAGNYAEILTDARLRAAFGHALAFIFFYALLPTGIGLVLAAVLTRAKARGLPLFRTLVFLPQVIAMVVVSVAFKQIYAPDGLLNSALRAIGLDALTRSWLGDYVFSLPAVGLIGSWVSTGLVTVLLLAGMARIPTELFEAARLDGAGTGPRVLRHHSPVGARRGHRGADADHRRLAEDLRLDLHDHLRRARILHHGAQLRGLPPGL